MESHELLREVIQKTGAKTVASDLGLSVSLIYKWTEPSAPDSGSGAVNPLDRIAALQRCTGDVRIAQWVCQQAGGFFVNNPKHNKRTPETLIPATHQIVQEFADLLSVISLAIADNTITKAESTDIRKRWEELKSVTEDFVISCEGGEFRKL